MWSASDARGKYEYADLNHDTKADQKTDQDRCEHGGSKVRLVIRQQSVHRLVWRVLPLQLLNRPDDRAPYCVATGVAPHRGADRRGQLAA
jgi:hypothetical protein